MLVSGSGTNLQALLDALGPAGPARVVHVISTRPDAGALERARAAGVPTTVLSDARDAVELLAALRDADLAVLASGAPISGATVHYVDEEYDRGPIIAQWPVPVRAGDTPESLAARVLEVEHRLLPRVVLELVRRGLPAVPVRLFAAGSTFVAGDQLGLDFEQGG